MDDFLKKAEYWLKKDVELHEQRTSASHATTRVTFSVEIEKQVRRGMARDRDAEGNSRGPDIGHAAKSASVASTLDGLPQLTDRNRAEESSTRVRLRHQYANIRVQSRNRRFQRC